MPTTPSRVTPDSFTGDQAASLIAGTGVPALDGTQTPQVQINDPATGREITPALDSTLAALVALVTGLLANTGTELVTTQHNGGSPVARANPLPVGLQDTGLTPIATSYRQVVVTSSAQSLATLLGGVGGVPATAQICVLLPEGGTLRWTDDGTQPTSALGNPLYAGTALTVPVQGQAAIGAVQLILDASAAGAKVNISFYKVV